MNAPNSVKSDEAWQRAAELGDRLVRVHVGRAALRRVSRGATALDSIALLFGAMTAAAQAIARIAGGEAGVEIEEWALAHVRGAIRGADGPLNADGSPWTEKSR